MLITLQLEEAKLLVRDAIAAGVFNDLVGGACRTFVTSWQSQTHIFLWYEHLMYVFSFFLHYAHKIQGATQVVEQWRKPLVTVVLNPTSMQLAAVKYVNWVITLLTNHWGVIMIPPIRKRVRFWPYLNPIGAARSVNWPLLPEVFFRSLLLKQKHISPFFPPLPLSSPSLPPFHPPSLPAPSLPPSSLPLSLCFEYRYHCKLSLWTIMSKIIQSMFRMFYVYCQL